MTDYWSCHVNPSLHIGALSIIWFVRRVAHGESGRKCEREFRGVRREERRGRGRGGDAQVPGRGRGHRDRDAEQPRGAPRARRRPAHAQQHSRPEARPERQTGTLRIFHVTTKKYFPVFKNIKILKTLHLMKIIGLFIEIILQTKRVGAKTIKEGWMVHFTDKDNMRKRHYWRLDSKSITMFKVGIIISKKRRRRSRPINNK